MQNPSARPQGRQQGAARGYERRDVNAKWIFLLVGALAAAGALTHLGVAGVMKALAGTPAATDAFSGLSRPPAAARDDGVPHLQISPAKDLAAFRAREDSELRTYGWVNRDAGIVRLPVERAMELILRRGLPSRSATNGDQTGPSELELLQQRGNNEPRREGEK